MKNNPATLLIPLKFFPYLIVSYEMAIYMSIDMYLPAMPDIADSFAVSNAMAQASIPVWQLGSASLYFLLGPISDSLGRRPVLFACGILFILACLAGATATDYQHFLLARFCQGVAVCSIFVSGYACIHELFEQKQAIKYLTIMGSIIIVAPGLGPMVGSLVLLVSSWHSIFYILAGWVAISLVLLYFGMPEPQRDPVSLHPLKIAKHLLAIASNDKFMGYSLPFCLLLSTFIAWLTVGPFLLIDFFELSQLYFGIMQLAIFAWYIVGAQITKRIIDKLAAEKIVLIGLSIIVLSGIVGLINIDFLPKTIAGIVTTMSIYCLGCGMIFGCLQRLAVDSCSQPMGLRLTMLSSLICICAAVSGFYVSVFDGDEYILISQLILAAAITSMVLNLCLSYRKYRKT